MGFGGGEGRQSVRAAGVTGEVTVWGSRLTGAVRNEARRCVRGMECSAAGVGGKGGKGAWFASVL